MSLIDEFQDVDTIDFNRALDFCVWVLEEDGLRTAPFDRHSNGSGNLRALGLGEASWRTWLEAVAVATERRAAYQREVGERAEDVASRYTTALDHRIRDIQASALRIQSRAVLYKVALRVGAVGSVFTLIGRAWIAGRRVRRSVPVVPFPDAVSLWSGDAQIAEELHHMYGRYKADRRSPRRRGWKSSQLLDYLVSPRFREFSYRIGELRTIGGTPPLVCFVNYAGPVVAPVTRSVVVIGVRRWDVGAATFERVVEDAVARLSPTA